MMIMVRFLIFTLIILTTKNKLGVNGFENDAAFGEICDSHDSCRNGQYELRCKDATSNLRRCDFQSSSHCELRREETDCCHQYYMCSIGHGGCNSNDECYGTSICDQDSCAKYGYFPSHDPSGSESFGCCVSPPAELCDNAQHGTQCCDGVKHLCSIGEGTCEDDDQCAGDLRCTVGACKEKFGWEAATAQDACCSIECQNDDCCSLHHSCGIGEGRCKNEEDCYGDLKCGVRNGAVFRLQEDVNVCYKAPNPRVCDSTDPDPLK